MAIEVVIRTAASDGIPVRQTTSRLSLDTAADITLGQSAPEITGHSKIGPDLLLSFADGQSLYIQNFFVLGPQGQYSQLIATDGAASVTGLMAPEPEPDEAALSGLAAGAGEPLSAPTPSDAGADGEHGPSFGESTSHDSGPGAEADWSNPLLLTGAGLASGYGTTSLIMSNDDSDTSGDFAAATNGAARDMSATNGQDDTPESPEEMTQEIAALIGPEEEEADLTSAVASLTGTTENDAPAPDSQAATTEEPPVETVTDPPPADDFLGGLIGDLQDIGFADAAQGTDFSAAMMTEADI